ncbi:hypothetical protein Tco_1553414 [Tanacetum coccineum]
MATLEFCDKHNMVAYLEKLKGSAEFHHIIDFLTTSHIHYSLTENPTIYASFIKQFWTTATSSTNVNGEVELTASIDGQAKTITEASLRRHLKLEDNGGITSLPNTEIFEQLALMGYATDSDKLTFQKDANKRVKNWKIQVKTSKASRRTKIVLSEDDVVEEDSSKQGRSLIEELDMDADISLVPPHAKIQGKISDETKVLLEEEEATEIVQDQGSSEKGNKRFLLLTLHLILPMYQLVLLVKLLRSPRSKCKKKGLVMRKLLDYKNRLMRKKEKGLQEEYDKAGKKEALTEVDTAHVIDWNDPSVIRYHALQNRPRSVAEVRNNMMVYLKNQGGYKMKDLKGMSYNDIRPIFEKVWDQIYSFVPMDSEEVPRLKRACQDVKLNLQKDMN